MHKKGKKNTQKIQLIQETKYYMELKEINEKHGKYAKK